MIMLKQPEDGLKYLEQAAEFARQNRKQNSGLNSGPIPDTLEEQQNQTAKMKAGAGGITDLFRLMYGGF